MTTKPPRILVVDDDQSFASALSTFLKGHGYQVLVAHDATTAIRHAQKEAVDLMTLDVEMPAGGGPFVIGSLRKIPRTAVIPIIVSTGSVNDDLREYVKKIGANDYIRKPYDLEDLLPKIKALLPQPPDSPAPAN